MRLVLNYAVPNKVLVEVTGDSNIPDAHMEFLVLLAERNHPVQQRFLQHLVQRHPELSLTFHSSTKYEIEYRAGTAGEIARAFCDSLAWFADNLERYPSLRLRRAHNLIGDIEVNFQPRDLVIFWLGGVTAEERRFIGSYLKRLHVR